MAPYHLNSRTQIEVPYPALAPGLEGGAPLANRTIVRFAHAFDTGGGTERYLDDLDYTLLERNPMTVIRLYLSRDASPVVPGIENRGKGKLIRIPLPIVPGSTSSMGRAEFSFRQRFKRFARDWLLYNPVVWKLSGAKWTASRALRPAPGQAVGAGSAFAGLLQAHWVDLAVLHFFGGADAEEVLLEARKAKIPTALLNHYSNDRFSHFAIRKHVMLADRVAGVNALDVPRYLRGRLTNVSDGIDTRFFQRSYARAIPDLPSEPVLLLPARVVREKGQLDLVRAGARLRAVGVHCHLAFAGRVDSPGFAEELRREISLLGMTESVRFLGNIGMEELRDWYAASAIVAFPTYHHEGLGRVIVEAQAMGTPVVAYATGGVGEGISSGKTGFLVRTGDLDGFTGRVGELLASASLRTTMGTVGRKAVEERFSLAALAERHEQFYQQAMTASTNQTANHRER